MIESAISTRTKQNDIVEIPRTEIPLKHLNDLFQNRKPILTNVDLCEGKSKQGELEILAKEIGQQNHKSPELQNNFLSTTQIIHE